MSSYLVSWVIDVEAETPEEAAKLAREFQNVDTMALCFNVRNKDTGATNHIDLLNLVES